MFAWAANPTAMSHLAITWGRINFFQGYQILTWPLYNPPSLSVAIALYFLFRFGTELEDLLGRYRFLTFVGALIIIPGIAAALGRWPLASVQLVEVGIFLAYALEFPGTRFIFNIPVRVFALVVVGIWMLSILGSRDWSSLAVLVAVIIVVAFGMRALGLGSDIAWVPRIPLPTYFHTGQRKVKAGRTKPGSTKPAKGSKRSKANLSVVPESESDLAPHVLAERRRRVDAILDKISANGMDSLTPEERDILQRGGK